MLFAAAEIALVAYLDRRHDHQEAALTTLNDRRRNAYAKVKAQLEKTESFINTFSSLSIDDLVAIAGEAREFRDAATRLYGKSFNKHIKGKFGDHRNGIMHAAGKLATIGELIKAASRAQAVKEAAEECLEALPRTTE